MEELKALLESVWKNGVMNAYKIGDLCSERNLQAELYHQLKISDKERIFRYWVEPCLLFKNHHFELNNLKPDLLVSKGREVVAIIELKYRPESECHYQNDLSKMKRIESVSLDNELYLEIFYCTGTRSPKTFSISSKVLSVFGVIAKDYAHAISPDKWPQMKTLVPSRLLHLRGITKGGMEEPMFEAQYFENESN